jgi:hypothetical protein
MNPFFEQRWHDAHTRLIAYISDTVRQQLPEDLVAGAEEEVGIGAEAAEKRTYPDIQVRERWALRETGAPAVATEPPVAATGPIRVLVDDEVERWVEIHDEKGRLITVIELLSLQINGSRRAGKITGTDASASFATA